MEQLLKDLLDRMGKVDLAAGIPIQMKEVEEGEVVAGILSDDLKRFFIVFNQMGDELANECEKAHGLVDKLLADPSIADAAETKAVVLRHNSLHKRQDVLAELFWQGVKEQFPEAAASADKIVLRKDWQVAMSREQSEDPLIELISLGALLGALGGHHGRKGGGHRG
jgi:hypothetical protein